VRAVRRSRRAEIQHHDPDMTAMRIVFMGTPHFAAVVLKHLVENGRTPVGVVSQIDRPKGRGRHLVPTPVREAADRYRLPVFQPEKLTAQAFAQIAEWKPDLIAVSAYGKILRKNLLDLPALGCINTHASLLPEYRGAAPLNWAIIRGEQRTGVTIMKLDEGMDTGPMFLREEIPIAADDNVAKLTEKAARLAGELLVEALDEIEAGRAVFTPQNEEDATYAPMLSKEDGLIDWTHSASTIERLIRGVTPWPGAQTVIAGKALKILSATADADCEGEPHVVLEAGKTGIVVAAGQGALRIRELQLEGKRAMTAAEFLNGFSVKIGERLGR
jgi:methionyl-tRNA formyltransferase